METNKISQKSESAKQSIHHVLAQSYFLFFVAVLSGLFLNTFFPIEINSSRPPVEYGVVAILLGTIAIVWAQKTSRRGADERRTNQSLTHEHFLRGPYKYFRSPTHVGLTLLVFGYGLVSNAFFVVMTALVFALISRLVYIKKEEKILEQKYGQSYSDYKKKVRI